MDVGVAVALALFCCSRRRPRRSRYVMLMVGFVQVDYRIWDMYFEEGKTGGEMISYRNAGSVFDGG